MAPATNPPSTPAATPGPQPHPRRYHAAASVAVAASVVAIVAAASKDASVLFIALLLGSAPALSARDRGRKWPPITPLRQYKLANLSEFGRCTKSGARAAYR